MGNKEQLERLSRLMSEMTEAMAEMENSGNIAFYKSLIQKKAIELYEQAGRIGEFNKPESISKTEVVRKPEPVETISEKIVEKVIPVIQEKVIPPQVVLPEPELIEEKKEVPVNASQPVQQITKDAPEKKPNSFVKSSKPLISSNEDDDNEEISLNEKISKSKQPVLNFAEKSKETPIKDLLKAISISKKFEFINGLFDGNSEAYKNCINTIQNSGTYQEAVDFLENGIVESYEWQDNEKLSEEFFSLVRRRFMN